MSLVVTCQCGRQFMASADLAGKRVPCPACGGAISVPHQGTGGSSPASSGPPIIVACACGGRFQAPLHLHGKRVPCPSCGQPIHVVRSTADEPLSLTGFDDSSFAADPLSARPRADGAWVQSRPRSEQPNLRPVIIAGSIGGGAVVLLILAMVISSLLPSGDGVATSETENSTTPPSVSQPSTVAPAGQAGNASLPVSAPTQDTAARSPEPTTVRPGEGPATTVKPPVSPPPAAPEPATQGDRKTPVKETSEILVGGLPLPVAKAFAKEAEALNHWAMNEICVRATAQGVKTEFELKAIAKTVGRENAAKVLALMAKYGLDPQRCGEILAYAEMHGWVDLKSL